jgi:hypothetical protein
VCSNIERQNTQHGEIISLHLPFNAGKQAENFLIYSDLSQKFPMSYHAEVTFSVGRRNFTLPPSTDSFCDPPKWNWEVKGPEREAGHSPLCNNEIWKSWSCIFSHTPYLCGVVVRNSDKIM